MSNINQMNLLNNYADKLISLMTDQVTYSTNTATTIKSAVVSSVNSDGTVNVFIPPDEGQIFSYISNQTTFSLKPGDSVELMLKGNNYNNCWIIAKHGGNYTGGSGTGTGLSDELLQSLSKLSQSSDEILSKLNLLTGSVMLIYDDSPYDLDQIFNSGIYIVKEGSLHCPSEHQKGVLMLLPRQLKQSNSTNYATLVFFPNGDEINFANVMYFRNSSLNTWNDWVRLPPVAIFG